MIYKARILSCVVEVVVWLAEHDGFSDQKWAGLPLPPPYEGANLSCADGVDLIQSLVDFSSHRSAIDSQESHQSATVWK